MKKIYIMLMIGLASYSFSQTKFEKGYFIDNSGTKVDCYIKNVDWYVNPEYFEFKKTENDKEITTQNISNIKEFAISNKSKYVNYQVDIDKTDVELNKLKYKSEPTYVSEKLLLKVLVEGDENLYVYNDSKMKKFFSGKPDQTPKQLLYFPYELDGESKVTYNNTYKQQLKEDLDCGTNNYDKVAYNETQLKKVFVNYNECKNPNFDKSKVKENKFIFNLNIRPRVNMITNSLRMNGYDLNFDTPSKTNFSIGLEAEFIFPFNNNKWSLALEPTYSYYEGEASISNPNFVSNGLTAKVDNKSIDIPISIRHYFFLNDKFKLFINAGYNYSITMDSKILFERLDGSEYNRLQIDHSGNAVFGAGLKYDKYSIEVRYNTNRKLLPYTGDQYDNKYSYTSFIFGYKLF